MAITNVKSYMRRGMRVKAHKRRTPPKFKLMYCKRCGDQLSYTEQKYGMGVCFPCMKGNRGTD